MSEGERSRKVRKTGSPKVKKAEVEVPNAEVELKAESAKSKAKKHSVFNTPHSAIKELPTANSQLQTEKMEVHHHPEVEKKGFKEYILEGLMIFLAVTMGFFAESVREHIGDRSKETEFMRSMVQDLKADTATLNLGIKNFTNTFLNVDTMLRCLTSDKPDGNIINHVVSNHFWLYGGYSYNNRTVQQLKNAGNFRLIQDAKVTDSIIIYDNFQNAIMINQYNDLKNTMYAYKDIEARTIHYKELKIPNSLMKSYYPDTTSFVSPGKSAFITNDKELVSLYYNRLFIHRTLGYLFIHNMKSANTRAEKLITFIKKEYHLEDE